MEGSERLGADPVVAPSMKPGDAGTGSPTSVVAARMERLLRMLLWVGDPGVARSLRSLSDAELKQQPAAIRTAVQALRRKRDPVTFIVQPQYRTSIALVAEAVSEDCLDAVVSALGEAADQPDHEQLLRALEEIRERFPVSTVALMLAYVSLTDMPSSNLCDEILESEERFKVPASIVPPDSGTGPQSRPRHPA